MGTTNFDAVAATTFTGALVGNVTGNVTGTLIGSSQASDVIITGDGAITVAASTVILTKGTAAAITIVAPTAGTHDGIYIWVISETAAAHVITCATDGFNLKGSSGTVTFGAAIGNAVLLHARNGHWTCPVKTGVTVA